jgi:hypothetical protein
MDQTGYPETNDSFAFDSASVNHLTGLNEAANDGVYLDGNRHAQDEGAPDQYLPTLANHETPIAGEIEGGAPLGQLVR